MRSIKGLKIDELKRQLKEKDEHIAELEAELKSWRAMTEKLEQNYLKVNEYCENLEAQLAKYENPIAEFVGDTMSLSNYVSELQRGKYRVIVLKRGE